MTLIAVESGECRTTCPYCGVGCGVVANVQADGAVQIRGDQQHPANFGRLCSKGSALADTLSLEGRLLHPAVNGEQVSWDSALNTAASKLQSIIKQHGEESVALYVSGQMLTEDYYVANKLVKGYLGTANIDTNSRLCMSSAVAGHKRAFGADAVPGCYEDIELAELVVITGSNLAWCHPIVYQRIVTAKKQRPSLKVVVIDPRGTASCDIADLHLALQPGTDVALFNGLLNYLIDNDKADPDYLGKHVDGAEAAVAAASAYPLQTVAEICGLDAAQLLAFYALFADSDKTLSLFSQGVNQSTSGTDKVNSIINCHLLTGRIGKPGTGPFSITGQPNAMGGREVGGLSNMLAAHMDLDDAAARQRVQTFWNSPKIADRPGLKAVELFEKIHSGEIKAVWIIATNPVVSLPNATRVREALDNCELVIVSDIRAGTDTSAYADILFPATGWAEKDGTVTNSERRISRQRRFLAAAGEARPDWWILCEMAKRLGFDGFDYAGPSEIFDEHARLSALDNEGSRDFDIGGLSGMDEGAYNALQPIQWPVISGSETGTPRLCSEGFYTPNRRAQMLAVDYKAAANIPCADFPFILNTGRIRDQWHTMTRTGLAAKLSAHEPEPFVEIHPRDALSCGISDGSLARLRSNWGAIVLRAKLSPEVQSGQVFAPIHWNKQTASDACVGNLVNPCVDPISGEPEFKHTPVQLEPFRVDWTGFALTRSAIDTDQFTWWARATGPQFQRYEFAGRNTPPDWSEWGRHITGVSADAEHVEYLDQAAALYRSAWIVDGRLEACIFVSPRFDLPAREWLGSLFAKSEMEALDRISVLAGRAADPDADAGAIVCSCFGVGQKTIERSIEKQQLCSVEAIGQCLKAGTNCGSCIPELRQILGASNRQQPGAA